MRISLIISTYNFSKALNLCLESVSRQTVMPDEIVIADDGSSEETVKIISQWRHRLPLRILHVWQENKGFRKSMIMNKGLAVCSGDYIIQIDGDIIMERHFISDHIIYARRGYFLCGSRSRINKNYTQKLLQGKNVQLSFFLPGIEDRVNAFRCRLLTPLFYKYNHLRGCNMSFWRDDIIEINGYDETFTQYGYEDEDVQERLKRLGRTKKFIKFMCIQYHIWHPEHPSKNNLAETRKLIDRNNELDIIRSPHGIDLHMNENNILDDNINN